MKKIIALITAILFILSCSTSSQSNQSNEMEAQDRDPLILINYCPELEELKQGIPVENNHIPNWENIESVVYEMILLLNII